MIKFKQIYLSDTDDYPADYINQKLQEFSGGKLGLEKYFQKISTVTSPAGQDLDQFVAMGIVNDQKFDYEYHGVVLGHYGSNSSAGFSTYTTINKDILMTQGYKPFPKEIALFEVAHQLIRYYNTHRGANPFIANFDAVTTNILPVVKSKVEALLPYLNVFENKGVDDNSKSLGVIEFFLKWNKKYLDFDGINGFQCVDVTKQYFKEVLNLPAFKGNAIDYWTDIPGLKRIKKTWYNSPSPGDIIIWNTNIGPYGHIAIVNWSRTFDFGAFEQNFPIGSPCHYQSHNYQNVLGWLRPTSG